MKPEYKTSYTLIGRALNLDDQDAWRELHDYYSKLIYYLLTAMNVESDDKDDLKQTVMIRLADKIKLYDKEKGGFRTWFSTLVRNEVLTHYRKKTSVSNSVVVYDGGNLDDEAQEQSDLDILISKEWDNYITKIVQERIRTAFRGNAIQVFDLDLQGYTTEEISKELGLSANTIYTLRKRVKRYLRDEAKSIIQSTEPG